MNVKQTIDISKSQKEIAENLNAVSNKTTRLDEEKAKLEEENKNSKKNRRKKKKNYPN